MIPQTWIEVIVDVASDLGLEIRGDDETFEVALDRWNSVAYRLELNRAGHLQVAAWDDYGDGDGAYGDASFSLRSTSDVVRFCQLLSLAIPIRARRKPGEV